MPKQQVVAHGLVDFQIGDTNDPKVKSMLLKDTAGQHTAYLVNPEALGVILQQGLGLASHWANDPDLSIQNLTGPKAALPGSHLQISRGRSDSEIALEVFVGEVRMTYMLPLDSLMNAVLPLLSHLEASEVKEKKPN